MKKFLQQLTLIVAGLSLQKKFQEKSLTPEEQSAIVDAYNKQYGENAFATDHASFEADQKAAADAAAMKQTFEALSGMLGTPAASSTTEAGANLVDVCHGGRTETETHGAETRNCYRMSFSCPCLDDLADGVPCGIDSTLVDTAAEGSFRTRASSCRPSPRSIISRGRSMSPPTE